MATNLIDTLKGYITPELIGKAAGLLGEQESGISKALGGILPGILGGVLSKGASVEGAGELLGLLKQGNFGSNTLANVSGLLTGESAAPANLGGGLLGSLLGNKASLLQDAVAAYSGVKSSSASSLLSMGAPLVMGLLGNEVATKGLNASGLVNLLMGQKDSILSALPSGFGSLLGLDGLSGLGSTVSNALGNVTTSKPVAELRQSKEEPSNSNWWLWLLGLGVLVFGAFYFLRGCNPQEEKVESQTTVSADTVQTAEPAPVTETIKSVTGLDLGSLLKKMLPDNTELNIPANGVESRLLAFIEDSIKVVDKTTWFDFDRLLFDTGKSTLQAQSEEQLTNVVAILKSYPKVNLKIGGYTDNTGNAQANLKLSDERAKAVMAELVKKGIDAGRLAAEGYGDQFPVASNDTEEGRAQNRRVSMRVTQK